MSNERIRISRRKALVGLGSIGLASAGAGLGTYAQFTDREEQSVTFTAGGIDGKIKATHAYLGEPSDDEGESSETFETKEWSNGGGVEVALEDVKPGDYGSFCFAVQVTNNPAWVASCVGIDADTEGDSYEPERDVEGDNEGKAPDEYDKSGAGELAENLLMIPFYRAGCPSNFWDGARRTENSDQTSYEAMNNIGNIATLDEFWNSREGTNDFEQLRPRTLREIVEGTGAVDTLHWNKEGEIADLDAPANTNVENGCLFLNGQLADSDGGTGSDAPQPASQLDPGDVLYFGYDWHVPFSTGNEVQGDRVEFNLGFTFQQVRHTSGPEFANIYEPGENTSGGS